MSFRHAMAWLVYAEMGPDVGGAIADHPNDRGKRTVIGLTTKTYHEWLAKQQRDLRVIDLVTVVDWHAFYWQDCWAAPRCAAFPPRLGVALFDGAAQHGAELAVQILQRTLSPAAAAPLVQDGDVGPKTLAALERALALHGSAQVLDGYLEHRLIRYERIAATDATQQQFLPWWRRRIEELRAFLEWVA